MDLLLFIISFIVSIFLVFSAIIICIVISVWFCYTSKYTRNISYCLLALALIGILLTFADIPDKLINNIKRIIKHLGGLI